MGEFVVGDIVAVPFPFSDLSGKKLRPAVVLALVEHNDIIFCQITSKAITSNIAIAIDDSDFQEGDLPLKSYVRPDKLFTGEGSIIQKKRGNLKLYKTNEILEVVRMQFIPS